MLAVNSPDIKNVRIRQFSWGEQIILPMKIDCLDKCYNWIPASLTWYNKENNTFFVDYELWDDKWNEWISIDSERLAQYGTHFDEYVLPSGFFKESDKYKISSYNKRE